MDTHKKEHHVALHYSGQEEIVRFTVRNTARQITEMTKKVFTMSAKLIDKTAALLNNRPRKCLNYRTPHEVLWSG